MKTNFLPLDSSILKVLADRPSRLCEILAMAPVRDAALRINRRRVGVSSSESADITVNERLQAMRRSGRITFDPATSRWDGQAENTSFPSPNATDVPQRGIT